MKLKQKWYDSNGIELEVGKYRLFSYFRPSTNIYHKVLFEYQEGKIINVFCEIPPDLQNEKEWIKGEKVSEWIKNTQISPQAYTEIPFDPKILDDILISIL